MGSKKKNKKFDAVVAQPLAATAPELGELAEDSDVGDIHQIASTSANEKQPLLSSST